MPFTRSDAEVVAGAIGSAVSDIYTAVECVVLAFDPVAYTVDLQVVTQRVVESASLGVDVGEELPILPDVRVLCLQGAAGRVRMRLTPGDVVTALCLMYSTAEFRQHATPGKAPLDTRTHHLAHAVCLPGLIRDADVLPFPDGVGLEVAGQGVTIAATDGTDLTVSATNVQVRAATVRIGIDDETDIHDRFVALSDKVDANFNAVQNTLGSGSAAGAGAVSFATAFSPTPTAATRVKAR